jgi:hypothetical protein
LGVYLPSLGAFAYRPDGTTGAEDKIIGFGMPGAGNSIPVPGNYDDPVGVAELGVYLPTLGAFAYRPAGTTDDQIIPFGMPGIGNSIPVPGYYDDPGSDLELAVYLPTLGAFAYRPAGTTGAEDKIIAFGIPGAGNSIPVPGNYDDPGAETELGVYLPSLGAFAYRSAGPTGDHIIGFGIPGKGNTIPVPGDYDGTTYDELGAYLPSLGAFAYRPAGTTGAEDKITAFGIPGAGNSIPVPDDYDDANISPAPFATPEADNSIPFSTIAPVNGGSVAGWVDFVPDLAGQAKKNNDPTAS